jgi:hypothetical protein
MTGPVIVAPRNADRTGLTPMIVKLFVVGLSRKKALEGGRCRQPYHANAAMRSPAGILVARHKNKENLW